MRSKTTWSHGFELAALIAAFGLCAACIVPPFSDFQGARLAGPGQVELTPAYSSIQSHYQGEGDHVQDNFLVNAAVGVTRFMDFRIRYERAVLAGSGSGSDESYGVNILGFGPKFSLIRDRVAVYLPVGFGIGENIESSGTWQFQPTALLSLPASKSFEATLGAKALIPFQKGSDTLLAFNLGLGLSTDLDKWAIRPEVGLLFNPGESGVYWHFGVGLSLNTRILKK